MIFIHICKAERDMEETVAVDRLNPFVPQNVLAPILFLQLLFFLNEYLNVQMAYEYYIYVYLCIGPCPLSATNVYFYSNIHIF